MREDLYTCADAVEEFDRRARKAILICSPAAEDHADVCDLLAETGWEVYHARNCREALRYFCKDGLEVILCEARLPDGTWKDVLSYLAEMMNPPALIVASRVADEQLWAEVLHLGGQDVLAKPFEGREVRHAVANARRHQDPASRLSTSRRKAFSAAAP